MKYINVKTQAVIETACELKGGDWMKVEAGQPKEKAETTARKNTRRKHGE